jgi:hypothetical protein
VKVAENGSSLFHAANFKLSWNGIYRENHTHGIHFGDKSPLHSKIALSATHIQDLISEEPKFKIKMITEGECDRTIPLDLPFL